MGIGDRTWDGDGIRSEIYYAEVNVRSNADNRLNKSSLLEALHYGDITSAYEEMSPTSSFSS